MSVCLFACPPVDTPPEGEEWTLGEELAGEDQGQPGTSGKPPLALAYIYPITLCICFGL